MGMEPLYFSFVPFVRSYNTITIYQYHYRSNHQLFDNAAYETNPEKERLPIRGFGVLGSI
jgi:hypothetical protein